MTRCSATSSFVDRSFDSQRTGPLVDRRLSPSTTQLYTSDQDDQAFPTGFYQANFDPISTHPFLPMAQMRIWVGYIRGIGRSWISKVGLVPAEGIL
jgi:hypothetical protein